MIRRLSRLFRWKLSLMNGVAALGGALLLPAPRDAVALGAAWGGVTLLAMGASALNQVLECDLDRLMQRTERRPLPRREMTPAAAAALGGGSVLSGLVLVASVGGWVTLLLGVLALFWYLAVYTPLKRRTSVALLLGAISGAAPPLLGWCAGGGAALDFRILLLCGLLYLWQIPHFWLFQQRHAADYRRAGLPLMTFRQGLLGLWLVALLAAALLLPAFGLVGRHMFPWYGALPLLLLTVWMSRSERLRFSCLNLVPLLVTLALAAPP